jgi:hypothetical protein
MQESVEARNVKIQKIEWSIVVPENSAFRAHLLH